MTETTQLPQTETLRALAQKAIAHPLQHDDCSDDPLGTPELVLDARDVLALLDRLTALEAVVAAAEEVRATELAMDAWEFGTNTDAEWDALCVRLNEAGIAERAAIDTYRASR